MAATPRRRAALLLLAVCLAPGARAQQVSPTPRRVDRVHDLVALMDRVETSPFSAHATDRHAAASADDPRPGVAFVRTRPHRSVTFRELVTDGPSLLSFGVGLVSPALVEQDAPVRFLAEVSSARDPTWRRVFDQTHRPSELPTDTGLVQHEVVLPGDGPLTRSVRLRALPGDESALNASWPGWSCPQLRSAGRALPLEQDPLVLPGAGIDLLARSAEARFGGGVDGALRPMDPAPGVELVGGSRPSLRLSAPARISWQVTVPEGAELVALVGVDARTSWHLGGGELELALQIDDRPVHLTPLDAASRRQDRGWREVRVDLSAWAGREVTLSLAAGEGQTRGPDVLAVGQLLLADRSGRPRLPIDAAPSVIVLLADTLRRDAVGPQTPNLQALADAGVRYDAAWASSSWTWPSTASLLTGLDPGRHRLLDSARPVMASGVGGLAPLLAGRGYTTGAFVANALVSRPAGLAAGFETFVLVPNARASTLNDRIEAWLTETAGSARLLYVHYMDPHAPYQPATTLDDPAHPLLPPEAGSEAMNAGRTLGLEAPEVLERVADLRAAYAAEVDDVDRAVGALFERLRAHGALDDALVVFVSDHGEEFLEHGRNSHGWQLYDEALWVPLSLTGFGASTLEPAVVSTPVSTRDLLPTLCALLGLEPPAGLAAPWPLTDVAQDGQPAAPVFAHTAIAQSLEDELTFDLAAVRHEGHKLLLAPERGLVELYDLVHDPGEQRDLVEALPERAARLRALLAAWLGATADELDPGVDPADIERARRLLRELGYLGDDQR